MTRRIRTCWLLALYLALASCALTLPSCATDGHFSVLGYSTKPNYDPNIRTVRVPIFKSRILWTVTPVVGMEMDLTEAVIREIHEKTPFRVVRDGDADTELRGTIVGFQKTILNYTQLGTVREAETQLKVELIWRDLRTGKILSRPPRRPYEAAVEDAPRQPLLATADSIFPPGTKPVAIGTPTPPDGIAGVPPADDREYYLDPVTQRAIVPVTVTSTARFIPEVGESITTAQQRNYDRLAGHIVTLLETPW